MQKRFLPILIVVFTLLAMAVLSGCQAKTLSFSDDSIRMMVGDSIELPLTNTPSDQEYEILSYNENIVRYADGYLYAVGTEGQGLATTVIEAKTEDVSVYLTIFVYETAVPEENDKNVVSFFLVNDDYSGYARAGITGRVTLAKGDTLNADQCVANSTTVGYVYSPDWYYDVACTQRVLFPATITADTALYKEPMLLRDGFEKTLKSGAKFKPGIDITVECYKESYGTRYYAISGLSYPELPYKVIQIPKTYYIGAEQVTISGVYEDALSAARVGYSGLAATLEKIILPSTIEVLGTRAFSGLSALTTVEYTDTMNLKEVGAGVFADTLFFEALNASATVSGTAGGGLPAEYYRGTIFANCLIYVDAQRLIDFSNTVYLTPTEDGALRVSALAYGASFSGCEVRVASADYAAYSARYPAWVFVKYDE